MAKKDRQGKCGSCGNLALPGTTRCQRCKDRAAERARERYAAKKAKGLCTLCPNDKRRPAIKGMTCCADCLERQRLSTASRRDEYAPRQKELAKAWYGRKKAEGTCPQCNRRPAIPGKIHCRICARIKSLYSSEAHHARRDAVLAHYGKRCASCGEDHKEFLEVDHIGGGGSQHFKKVGLCGLFKDLIDRGFPAGFRTLCSTCNNEHGRTVRRRLEDMEAQPDGPNLCVGHCGRPARLGWTKCYACALKQAKRERRLRARRREAVLDHYGRECTCCGSKRALELDHVDGGGNRHRREIGSSKLYH
jgi:hypothetical protein